MHRAFNLENLVRFQGGLPLRRSTSIRTDAPIFLTWGEHRTGRRAGRDSAVRCREERRRAALPRTGLWIDPRALHHLEGQADRRRQRFRKPPSDEPWRSAPALRLLPPLHAADAPKRIWLRSPFWRARPPPSASIFWRASPISDGSWLLTSGLGHPGISKCNPLASASCLRSGR